MGKATHLKKFAASVALFAVLLTSVTALAESLSASDLPACCAKGLCPLHHPQGGDHSKNCDAKSGPAGNSCSVRACDMTQAPAAGIASFVLVVPFAIQYQSIAESAPPPASRFYPVSISSPATPPPRTLPS
jgi:hypothetical protein